MSGHETTVRMGDGRVFVIPDIWLAGFCTHNKCSVEDAIAWWAWQDDLERMATADE